MPQTFHKWCKMNDTAEPRSRTPLLQWWSSPLAIGVVGVLLVLVAILLTIQIGHEFPATSFPKEFHNHINKPILAIEVASTAEQAEEVLGTPCPCVATGACKGSSQENCSAPQTPQQAAAAISAIRVNTYSDFFFILLYALFLSGFAMLFALRADRRPTPLGVAVACVALLAALCDVMENVGIFRELNAALLTDSLARFTGTFSRCKWSLLALALVLTAVILLRSASPVFSPLLRKLVATGYLFAGVLIVLGVLLLNDEPAHMPQGIQIGTGVWGVVVLVNVTALLRWKPARQQR